MPDLTSINSAVDVDVRKYQSNPAIWLLSEIHQQISSCHSCSLRETCTQPLVGEGSEQAKILFVGGAPTESDDTQKTVFSAETLESGHVQEDLLRKHLRTYGFSAADYYLTNLCRCRPPFGREPSPEEIERCWEHTLNIIRTIDPRIIVTLGRPALGLIARKLGLSKKVGQLPMMKLAGKQIYSVAHHIVLFPMTHPGQAQRSSGGRAEFQSHLRYLQMAIPGWLERKREIINGKS